MKTFFQSFLGAFLALIVFTMAGVLLLIGIGAALASKEKAVIDKSSVLVIDLSTPLRDVVQPNPFAELSGNADEQVPSLYETIRLIRYAKTDPSVRGIYIRSNFNNNGLASSQALRNALADFKANKKFIIAYGDYISQSAYYVASVADKVYCNPKGALEWKGMAVELFFMKRMLEKLDIQPQVFYAGKFKSATEPLREEKMTDANRLQTSVLLQDVYGEMLRAIAQSRGLDTVQLRAIAGELKIQTADDAVRFKMADGLKYDDEVKAEIRQKLQLKKDAKINFITLGKYHEAVDLDPGSSKGKIAVLYASGDIVYGKGEDGEIASDEFRRLITKIRTDDKIKALVLRVNSPGGSSLASEIIWRELSLLKKEKPVVVSMGNYAASGGYYISCMADSIFAEPNTLTGSIGVFAVLPNIGGFMTNKLGITFDGVKTGNYSDFPTITRPLTESEKQFMQHSVDNIYIDFKTRVSEGRRMKNEAVDSIAQGRVWTGRRAVEIGLVDKMGSLDDAIASAVRLAKLKDYQLKSYPEEKSFLEQIFKDRSPGVINEKIKAEIGEEHFKMWQQIRQVKDNFGTPLAKLPFEIQFK